MLDLQIFTHAEYRTELDAFKPQAIGFSVNCPSIVPEVIDFVFSPSSSTWDEFALA